MFDVVIATRNDVVNLRILHEYRIYGELAEANADLINFEKIVFLDANDEFVIVYCLEMEATGIIDLFEILCDLTFDPV